MRHVIAIVAVCVGLQAVANTQAPGTPSELADDRLAGALWRIAVATETRIGFESIEFVTLPVGFTRVPAFPVESRDEALTAAIGVNSRYDWRTVGDVVLVRPKGAWSNPSNPFNRPVRDLQVHNATSSGALFGLKDLIHTNRFAAHSTSGRPVSFDVPSGTVVDVLNRLMESSDAVLWIAAYRPGAGPGQRFPRWDLQLQLRNSSILDSMSESHSPPLR